MKLSSIHTDLLALLKIGLWQDTGYAAELTDATSISVEVLSAARRQAVLGIVCEGMDRLNDEGRLPRVPLDEKLQMVGEVTQIESRNKEVSATYHLLAQLLTQHGIRFSLLKGQGIAQEYAAPLRRTPGDIDIFAGADYHKAKTLLMEQGIITADNHEDLMHLSFSYHGVPVELHHYTTMLYTDRNTDDFQQWAMQSVSPDHLQQPTFTALYLFLHLFRHFLESGLGLRQLCDWTLYLHNHADEIDQQQLTQKLHQYGLTTQWQLFGSLIVSYLSLPPNKFPLYRQPADPRKLHTVVSLILNEGNFGQTGNSLPIKGKIGGVLHVIKNNLRVFTLFPKDSLLNSYRFLKNIVKKRMKVRA